MWFKQNGLIVFTRNLANWSCLVEFLKNQKMSVASAKDDDVDDPEKSQCGFFGCRPDFLKVYNNSISDW